MNIKVLTGHLTQTQKKAIKVILNAGLMSGKVGMINYFLSEKDEIYSVRTVRVNKTLQSFTNNQLERFDSTFILTSK